MWSHEISTRYAGDGRCRKMARWPPRAMPGTLLCNQQLTSALPGLLQAFSYWLHKVSGLAACAGSACLIDMHQQHAAGGYAGRTAVCSCL